MTNFTVHIWDPGQQQTSVFDYEGWAHSRPAGWSEYELKETNIDFARKSVLREYRGYVSDRSYISDKSGKKFPVWTDELNSLWGAGKLRDQPWML